MRPADSALGIFRSPDPDLCVPGRRILRPREPWNGNFDLSHHGHGVPVCGFHARPVSCLTKVISGCSKLFFYALTKKINK